MNYYNYQISLPFNSKEYNSIFINDSLYNVFLFLSLAELYQNRIVCKQWNHLLLKVLFEKSYYVYLLYNSNLHQSFIGMGCKNSHPKDIFSVIDRNNFIFLSKPREWKIKCMLGPIRDMVYNNKFTTSKSFANTIIKKWRRKRGIKNRLHYTMQIFNFIKANNNEELTLVEI